MISRVRPLVAAALILALVLGVFGQTAGHRFLNYDDDTYVVQNPLVRDGLTAAGLLRSLRPHAANWHPLTWVSHMLDVQLFGMRPGGHHLVNVLFHAANAALLFAVLRALTGALGPSLLVAALFAVHPQHVESVAWVAERKDVLSAFFTLLAVAAWIRHLGRPSWPRYAGAVVLGGCALAAKAMAVTLPIVLLLLDYWPLGRFRARAGSAAGAGGPSVRFLRLAVEKTPFLALALADGLVTLYAQHAGRRKMVDPGFPLQVANAVASYAVYLWKTVVPTGLAALYPYPTAGIPPSRVATAAVLLAAISVWAFRARREDPALPMGWLWYLVTLLPVIGLHQVGAQSRADRYTYIPLTGIFIAVAWWASPRIRGKARPPAAVAAVLAVAALAAASYVQVGRWRDSATIMGHTVRVTQGNAIALNNLGVALMMEEKQPGAAAPLFLDALAIDHAYRDARFNLGAAYFRLGRCQDAVAPLRLLVTADPADTEAAFYLGGCLFRLERYEEASAVYEHLRSAVPGDLEARYYLGLALLQLGRYSEAAEQLAAIVAVRPDYLDARIQLAVARAGEAGRGR